MENSKKSTRTRAKRKPVSQVKPKTEKPTESATHTEDMGSIEEMLQAKLAAMQEQLDARFKELNVSAPHPVQEQQSNQQPQQPQPIIIQQQDPHLKFGSGIGVTLPEDDKIINDLGRVAQHTFITIGRGFILSVYKQEGSYRYAPYNKPIEFRWQSFDGGKSGLAKDIIHFCIYSTYSKKERDFIMNSPYYGKTIFDSITQAKNVNPSIISHINSSTAYVNGLNDSQLISTAKQYGWEHLPATEMKTRISQIKLQEFIDADRDYTQKAANSIMEAIQNNQE